MGIFTGVFRKTKGNVGDIAFRQQGGQTIMSERIRQNASGGEGASYNQRLQRCRLANVVNMYKVIRRFEAKAWESKGARVSDYNMFASKNLSATQIYLPKDYANLGATVMARYMVSQGSLAQIAVTWLDSNPITSVKASGIVFDENLTVAALSAAIIEQNPDFKDGDKLTFGVLRRQNIVITGASIPGHVAEYIEFELNTSSEATAVDVLKSTNASLAVDASGSLSVAVPVDAEGFILVHTREANSKLFCSTQYIVMRALTYGNQYSNKEWQEYCAGTYGYKPQVLIEPTNEEIPVGTYFSINATGGEHGHVQGAGRVAQGSSKTLTGVPDDGYRVKGWYDNAAGSGEALGTGSTYTIADVQEDVTIFCLFEPLPGEEVTITATVGADGGGTVTGGGTYPKGSQVTLTAVPENDNYQFMSWSDGNSSNPRTFTANESMTISANFLDLSKI